MIHFFAKLLFGVCIFGFVTIPAAQGGDLAQEYDQVRKIALKDPKVRAAFDRANEKLNKRIIEIDPALKPFVEGQRAEKAEGTGQFTTPPGIGCLAYRCQRRNAHIHCQALQGECQNLDEGQPHRQRSNSSSWSKARYSLCTRRKASSSVGLLPGTLRDMGLRQVRMDCHQPMPGLS